jgi:putative peptidoglycan lipid II flippase
VALGVVLTPQLASAKAAATRALFGHAGLGPALVVLLAVPCAVALLTFARRWWPRCSTTAS